MLQVSLQVVVAIRDPGEEVAPERAVAARRDGGDLGVVAERIVGKDGRGLKNDGAPGRVQQPRIGIPLLRHGCMGSIRTGQVLDSGASAGAQNACAERAFFQSLAGLAADRAG